MSGYSTRSRASARPGKAADDPRVHVRARLYQGLDDRVAGALAVRHRPDDGHAGPGGHGVNFCLVGRGQPRLAQQQGCNRIARVRIDYDHTHGGEFRSSKNGISGLASPCLFDKFCPAQKS